MKGAEFSRLAIRPALEDEIRKGMAAPDAEYIEWETAGLTFIRCPEELIIIRAGAMGGDVREIHGGWKYLTILHLNMEWNEMRSVVESFRRHGIGG